MTVEPARADGSTRRVGAVRVLEADPDLGSLLSGHRLVEARQRLVAREHVVPAGPWIDERVRHAGVAQLGLLVVVGVVARELLISGSRWCSPIA